MFKLFNNGGLNSSVAISITMLALAGCGGGSDDPIADGGGDPPPPMDDGDPPPAVSCSSVHIVNLSRDSRSSGSCVLAGTREDVADCVETSIRNALPEACTVSFDVFVPGTAAEHGAWKQFNSMFSRDTGRGYLSLQYQDSEYIGGNNFDAALYDNGVLDGKDSLDDLLYTLKSRFKSTDVRVFGHSKGSHTVALTADDSEFSDMSFYAFAQPKRTAVDISGRGDIGKGKLGDPGKIHKLSSNLVGITWGNDEVKFYSGGPNGLLLPEKWGFPGYIWQDTVGGTLSPFRIDHHNNYGGRYTDGDPANNWRDGEGSTDTQYAYCATGNKQAMSQSECRKQRVEYVPYFWSDSGCRNKAFDMMENASTGAKHNIGYSGPRGSNCAEKGGTINVDYSLKYNLSLADNGNDCRYDLKIRFQGLGDRADGGEIAVSSTADTGWKTKTGTVRVPRHMRIRIKASMSETDGFGDCGHLTAASEGYIRDLKLTFTHPFSSARKTRTVIGLNEGRDYVWPIKLDMQNNVAWWKWNDPNDSRDTWDLFYAHNPPGSGGGALMIKGDTDENRRGWFYKWLHLLD